ncbi:MAG: hypothetical protein G01um101425_213 [Candidatus Peregrinibacteria bacterium Gr01-1014_25]|nr:MAG: hypothetical protein G01um101425_213 [Candidatus Peregrinibacteria bacterium Gr01-1014_25]
MHRLRTFFQTVLRTCSDVGFYRTLRKRSLRTGTGYAYALLTLLSFVGILALAIPVVTVIPSGSAIDEKLEDLRVLYPEDLTLTIDNGLLTSSDPKPVVIPFPTFIDQEALEDEGQTVRSLATIDTSASVEDYPARGSLVLLTRGGIVIPEESGYRVISYPKEPLTITREEYVDGLARLRSMLPMMLWVLLAFSVLVLPFIAGALSLSWHLLWLLLPTFVLWLIHRLRKAKLSYGALYRLSLYGMTPVVLLQALSSLVGLGRGIFAGFWSLVLLAFMYVVTTKMATKK